MRWIRYAVPCLCLGILCFACATGRTPLSTRAVPPVAEPTAAALATPPWPVPPTLPEGARRLYLTTRPESAEIFIDKRFSGLTPLTLEDFPSGQYYIEVRKPGYRSLELWLNYSKNQEEYYWLLERETGTLDLSLKPTQAVADIADRRLSPGPNVLPAGVYTVTSAAFGYKSQTSAATVNPDMVTRLDVTLEKAPFEFSELALSRSSFNPRLPGPAATVSLNFLVSGPGDGLVEIRDGADKTVARLALPSFADARQCVVWNGEDANGAIVADGAYRLVLTVIDSPASAAAEVTVDSALSLEHQHLWSGTGGLAYAVSPAVPPAGSFEIAAVALTGLERRPDWSSPLALGARIGLGSGWEADVVLGSVLSDLYSASLLGSASVKMQLLPPADRALSAALVGKITYHHGYQADVFTNPTAVTLGLPARLTIGPVSLYAGLDLCLALYKLSTDRTQAVVPGAWVWLYGRAGLSVTVGVFSVGLSTAVRTLPFDGGWGLALPIPTALEVTVFLPDSSVYLTAVGLLEWEAAEPRAWAGFGFGLLW